MKFQQLLLGFCLLICAAVSYAQIALEKNTVITITELYTGEDQQSHFKTVSIPAASKQPLGLYSQPFPVSSLMFRDFESGAIFDWHPAPQAQYIIYLEGEVEIEIGSGEKRRFKAGDILLANDLTGKGHITRTITAGKSVIVPVR